MTVKLPRAINDYFDASNAHNLNSIVFCFSDGAVVCDEGKEFRGKEMIQDWIVKTIEKYKFQFEPVSIKDDNTDVVVAAEVSGTFDGSPITLDYHFAIEGDKIVSLIID